MGKSLKDVVKVPIAATQAGAYMRPEWFTLNFEGGDMTRFMIETKPKALFEDALKLVMHEQEQAGLDIFTDGCLRYDDFIGGYGWAGHLAYRLGGIRFGNAWEFTPGMAAFMNQPGQSEFLKDAMWQWMRVGHVAEKLSAGNLQFAEFYKFARRFTDRPLRFTTPEACMTGNFLLNSGKVYRDDGEMFYDIARILNGELRRLVDAGCTMIQLDYPIWPAFYMGSYAPKEMWGMLVDLFNKEVEGVNAQIWIHVDWGRPMNQYAAGGIHGFEEMFKNIANAKIDVIGMEAASTRGANLDKELPIWKEHCSHMDLCVGGVNHRVTVVESPEEVATTLRHALKYCPPEKLAVYNDCGLSALPRPIAYGKLRAIAQGAALVRKELGLSS